MEKVLTKELNGGIGSAYDHVNERLLVAEWGGTIAAVDDSGRTVLGAGYGNLEDIVVSADGRWGLVSERGGALLRVDLSSPDRTRAQVVVDRLGAPHQIALVERRNLAYVVEFARSGRLLAVALATGRTSVIADRLDGAIGLVLDRDLTTAYISEQATTGGRITAVPLTGGTRRTVATGLVNPFMLAWSDDTQTTLLVAERDPANRISAVDVRRRLLTPITPWPPFRFGRRRLPGGRWPLEPSRPPQPLRPRLATPRIVLDAVESRPSSVQAVNLRDSLLYVVSDKVVTRYDLTPTPTLQVEFDLDPEPMFVGAYQRVGVHIIGSGASFDDIRFEVVEGPRGGRLSPSVDDTFSGSDPHVMLLAGFRPGDWTLRASHRTTGDVLGETTFTTTTEWRGTDGPPLWFDGVSQPAVTGSAWGGGSSGPQNVDVVPQSGTRDVAILLVDTSTQRYPADTTALRQEWADETFNGITVGGQPVSCHHYLQEVSLNQFGLNNVGVFGPVQLPGAFEDYFQLNDNGLWVWQAGFFQAAVTAGDDLIDFDDVDSLVVVVRSAPPVDPASSEPAENSARFAWPWATSGNFTTDDGNASIAVVVMPHDWGDGSDREIRDTLTHELGHNLGLPDLYMNATAHGALATRDIDTWDIMSWDDPLPHLSAPNRMRLGWIETPWVRAFDFANSGAVDETITLRATALGAPQAGEFSAVEVRLADGWNYYFEYRSEQTGQIGDQELTTDRRVLGTDVVSPSYTAPVARRDIILLPNDGDGDGPILGVGDDYEETDVSDPMFPTDFSVDVVSTDDDTAQIRVRYGANSRPDPSIRPWPGSGTNAWQSPDIEVRNDKNAADASLANIPWTGHANTVVAKVRNVGSLLAQDVRVNFSVKDFTVGGGAETPLGFVVQDIPAGATVDFEFEGWVPPSDGHYCVVARIPLHVENGPPVVVEMTELNNLAQSNYSEFISASASPPARQRTFVTVGNPYPERTRVHLVPKQTNPFFRTYVGATLIELDPGEERRIEFMFESLLDTDAMNEVFEKHPEMERHLRSPNIVNLTGYIEDPRDPQLHSVHAMGGVIARVRSGTGTRVHAEADGNVVYGRVEAADKSIVTSGQVIVGVRDPGRPESERTAIATVQDGSFHAEFREELHGQGLEATAEYLGDQPWAPSPEYRFVT